MSAPPTGAARVLVSRYDPEYAVRAERTLAGAGFAVDVVDSLREIQRRALHGDGAWLVVLTGGLAEPTTRAFLAEVEDAAAPVAVLALAERLDADRAERYRRAGIDEVLPKPFDAEELALVARRLLLRAELSGRTHIVGRSEAIQLVLERVAQFAPVHSTVLIEGESGTGKELIARAIHDHSPRAGRPFIAVNGAALTESLLESELFGHEKGAFTGAIALRKGRFELAQQGTLFLDEVGEMPPATQVKLLRVLEEREFLRVGGSVPIRVDVRVIAATNRELEADVRAGVFRRDLFYRLNVLHVRMPPLRERREDIPLLVHHFAQMISREQGRADVRVADDAMAVLQNYDWPGNVRELRNVVESVLVVTAASTVRTADLPPEIVARAGPERLLPMMRPGPADVAPGDGEPDGRRLEALLGLFYQDLKGELEAMRRDTDAIREAIEAGRGMSWLETVEVEPDARTPGGEDVAPPAFAAGMTLAELEREAIARSLAAHGGNRRHAARALGIGERTLYRKLKEYTLS